eukprot:scaffold3341_cov270-Chaetoceros_neogracile.AAC.7
MYGGATLQPDGGGPGMNGASPIPQQWWDQNGTDGPSDQHSPDQYARSNPNLSHQMDGMHMDRAPAGHSYGPYNHDTNQGSGGPSTPMGMGNAPPPPPPHQKAPAANGLIRLTLKKPMGIVFEPMEDPHNPSQQRGVRICDLPRTGAAAMSGMLEVGDELLSINNKPMSRLTFDEIMDFIIDADAENVDLLFRRPKKDKMGKFVEGAKNASTVKWDKNYAPAVIVGDEDGTVEDSPKRPGKAGSPRRKYDPRDEESLYSGDETFYTEQTSVTEDTRKDKRRGKRNGRRYESESFLDMLIDTVCAPVMGGEGRGGYDSDDDQTFNSMEDGTYDSRDEDKSYLEQKKKKWQESKKKNIGRLKKESEDEKRRKKRGEKQKPSKTDYAEGNMPPPFDPRSEPPMGNMHNPYGGDVPYSEPQNPQIISPFNVNGGIMEDHIFQPSTMHSPPRSPRREFAGRTSTPTRQSPRNTPHKSPGKDPTSMPSSRFLPEVDNSDMLETDPKMPFKEIIYDDQVDEQVSVMESVGGPSLLLENLRNAAQIKRTVDNDMIVKFGKDFKTDLGLTKEESIQMNPERFYRHAVKTLLQAHEPEKVRLMDKLFDKYRGREVHLIRKLDARYEATIAEEKPQQSKSVSTDNGSTYDGFKAFGGGDISKSTSGENGPSSDAWHAQNALEFQSSADGRQQNGDINNGNQQDDDDHSSYTESEDYGSIDGTSPEVIAQVSELLNYVYGKTTVAGQIDRVSTIMRAYEGREAILLELLETKALLKANNDKESLEGLPESLRDNPGLQQDPSGAEVQVRQGSSQMMSPISNMSGPSNAISKDSKQRLSRAPNEQEPDPNPFDIDNQNQGPSFSADKKKKKKGIFGSLFKKKKNKNGVGGGGAFPTNKKGALLGAENRGY